MKRLKILVYTSIYPLIDDQSANTKVVHEFCKNWVAMGNDVFVIVNQVVYPNFFYRLTRQFQNLITTLFAVVVPDSKLRMVCDYQLDGVKVSRLPIRKLVPYGDFHSGVIKRQHKRILSKMVNVGFDPDLAIGHWENPQIPLLCLLKNDMPHIPVSCVFHSSVYMKRKFVKEAIQIIDLFGFRNQKLMKCFSEYHKLASSTRMFLCPSGISREFMNVHNYPLNIEKHHNQIQSVLFVGMLIKRKNPQILLELMASTKCDLNLQLTIVGVGRESIALKREISRLNLNDKVMLTGHLGKDEVYRHYMQCQLFIMNSKNEAFGMVYLEAMAAGCIVIATRNEGFDGIIVNGENGYICDYNDIVGLTSIVRNVSKMDSSEKVRIALNARNTAELFLENRVAADYLRKIYLFP